MKPCEYCGVASSETHREGCPYWHDAAPKPQAPLWEKLTRCQYGVPHPTRGSQDCGDPALHRLSYDGGKTWLYLCDEHAAEIDDKEAT